MGRLFGRFFEKNFSYKGKESLSKLTILFIIILDISVLITVMLGVDFQVKVLNNPNVIFSYKCTSTPSVSALDSFNNYYYKRTIDYKSYSTIRKEQLDHRCKTIHEYLEIVRAKQPLKHLKTMHKQRSKEIQEVTRQLDNISARYNTALFENISEQTSQNSNTLKVKKQYDAYVLKLSQLKQAQEKQSYDFKMSSEVQALKDYIGLHKNDIQQESKHLKKLYSIKQELLTLLFLLPLLFLAFLMMRRYLVQEKYMWYVLFKNIVFVILIPTFISLISLIFLLLPKVFFERLMQFLIQIEIPFIAYYIAVALIVVLFGMIIVKIQHYHRNRLEQMKKNSISKIDNFNKHLCNNCFAHVNYVHMNYCPNCQNQLKRPCVFCGKNTITDLDYCMKCGCDQNKQNSSKSNNEGQ